MVRMPVVFLGHGSPMNAIEDNPFTEFLSNLGKNLQRPDAIAVISAHYLKHDTRVTSSERPETIHDFYGFPDELYGIEYNAPGSPATAGRVVELISRAARSGGGKGASLDPEWGLSHASWAVLRRMYPKADVPVIEISLDMTIGAREHASIGKALAPLRDEGVLVLGSGNIVHNLRMVDFSRKDSAYGWASGFDSAVKESLERGDLEAICDYEKMPGGSLSVPTPDHYLPFVQCAGCGFGSGSRARTIYEEMQYGSLSMRCVSWD